MVMNIFIAVLRGINVSGKKIIKMDILTKLLEELNLENVTTYVQSGNAVFSSNLTNVKEIADLIHDKILESLNFEVPVLILSIKKLKNIIENNPFLMDLNIDKEFLHYTFLANKPSEINTDKIEKVKNEDEQYFIVEDVVYLYCPSGYGKTKLTNIFFENLLNVSATTRNQNTTTALLQLALMREN
ncbi:DUF1697 domain-containing protein [Empedobacter tilapiae]|uniref:DUF1697 domain-containing protein n=2 Tax=Empedobacter tilapiae TaxID=2491114 RepID=A0A4Z1BCG4_9FLAO|nr:DUF1697 domain-containing protein [Empedobacter tilapiae]